MNETEISVKLRSQECTKRINWTEICQLTHAVQFISYHSGSFREFSSVHLCHLVHAFRTLVFVASVRKKSA